MRSLRHPIAAFVLLMTFASLFVAIYNGFETNYDIQRGNLNDEGNTIAEELRDLTLIDDIEGFISAIYRITAPKNFLDVLGGLLSAGLGVLKIISGIITFPLKILAVLVGFYPSIMPAIIERTLDVLVSAYIGFLILSAILKSDV